MTEPTIGQWRDVLEKAEWVGIVTSDGGQPHVVANWGDYIRNLSKPNSDTLVLPAGRYHQTEAKVVKQHEDSTNGTGLDQAKKAKSPASGATSVARSHAPRGDEPATP